jgi:hypothetical protein
MGEGLEPLVSEAPAGRPASGDEIAEAMVFLATDRASFLQAALRALYDPCNEGFRTTRPCSPFATSS